jgi:dienelactone hydrolase
MKTLRFLCLTAAIACCALALMPVLASASSIPSIAGPIPITRWRVIGPFLSGMREAGTDPLAYYDKDAAMEDPLLQGSFPSLLVPGLQARWQYYEAAQDGSVSITFPNVTEQAWKLIGDEWGSAGSSFVGYAYASFDVEDGPRRALIDAQGVGGFVLNGMPYPGDAYGHGMFSTPVILQDGRNELKVGFGRDFKLRVLPVTSDLIVLTSAATLPDLVRGEPVPRLFQVPLLNTTEDWMQITGAKMECGGLTRGCALREEKIPPFGVTNFYWEPGENKKLVPADYPNEATITLTLEYDDGRETSVDLKVRVRDASQSRRVTFASAIDGSVQYYGLLPPKDYDLLKEYGLILSLHGAGVEAEGQVDAYKPKDWAFVVAPTNRRRFGFDWQDWGRLDMLEVYHDVLARWPIDENRVHLTGHSMGGHGTWYNAFTYPDLWATAAPSAGWTNFDLYVPTFLRQNVMMGAPKANMIWNLAMREDNTLVLSENALNLPIYALEGGADDNVPPQQPRMLSELLAKRGYDIRYEEVPGMGHWWDEPETPFVDCVDNEYHNEFWKTHTRNLWPKEVVFRTHNYSINDGTYWVRVDAPMQYDTTLISFSWPVLPYQDIVVRAEADLNTGINVTTSNVSALSLNLDAPIAPGQMVRVSIDGIEMNVPTGGWTSFIIGEGGEGWEVGKSEPQRPYKSRDTYGPWKQVLIKPFIIAYGTTGSPEQTEWNLQLARLYAYHWWYRANGHTTVMKDTEVNFANPGWETLNCVLIGGPECNAVTAKLQDKLPIAPMENGVKVGETAIPGKDLTYKFVYPNPLTDYKTLVLVEGGTSLAAMKRLPAVIGIYSGSGFPDWMVWGDEFKLQGFGGVRAMGFFDFNWRFDDSLSFFNDDLNSREGMGVAPLPE